MDTLLRAFGRTTKVVEKKEEVKEKPTEENKTHSRTESSTNHTDEDLFSNLVVSPISNCSNQQPLYHHLNEIEDLDISFPVKSEDGAPSAFIFMNSSSDVAVECQDDEGVQIEERKDSAHGDRNESSEKSGQPEDSVPHDTTTITSKFSFIRQDDLSCKQTEIAPVSTKPKKIKKKTRSIKPGFANVDQPQTCSSPPDSTLGTEIPTESPNFPEEVKPIEVKPIEVKPIEVKPIKVKPTEVSIEEGLSPATIDDEEVSGIEDNRESTVEIDDMDCTTPETVIATSKIDISKEDEIIIYSDSQVNEMIKDNHYMESSLDNEHDLDISAVDNPASNIESKDTYNKEKDTNNKEKYSTQCSTDKDKEVLKSFVEYKYYGIEMNEEDSMYFKFNLLKNQEEVLRLAKSTLIEKQKELIEEWERDHDNEASIRMKINELREMQLQLENDEDYDEAANINQSIMELKKQCDNSKYQYPLLDNKFLNNIQDYKDLCARFDNEYKYMLEDYMKISKWFEKKDSEIETNSEKKLNEMTLVLKEKKLKVERDKSHVTLDKEHLVKKETVLNEEVEKQTKGLSYDKSNLLEKRAVVQENIAELLAKLQILRDEENRLNSAVSDIDTKVDEIMTDFQPRVESLSKEMDQAEETERVLAYRMEELLVEENEIESKREEVIFQKNKNQEIVNEITNNIKTIKKYRESSSSRDENLFASLDFDGLKFDSNSELLLDKEHLKRLTSNFDELQKQVLRDEGEGKRLQRSLTDMQAQLAEMQKIKQVHVKERKYKDAKSISDEIKSLTSKGEEISNNAMKFSGDIKTKKEEMHNLSISISSEQEKINKRELFHDQLIIEKLNNMNTAINDILESHLEDFVVEILTLQLLNNSTIIDDLSLKHGISREEETTTVVRSTDEDIDVDGLTVELDELEESLRLAESEENWERAEEINLVIERKKKLLEIT